MENNTYYQVYLYDENEQHHYHILIQPENIIKMINGEKYRLLVGVKAIERYQLDGISPIDLTEDVHLNTFDEDDLMIIPVIENESNTNGQALEQILVAIDDENIENCFTKINEITVEISEDRLLDHTDQRFNVGGQSLITIDCPLFDEVIDADKDEDNIFNLGVEE